MRIPSYQLIVLHSLVVIASICFACGCVHVIDDTSITVLYTSDTQAYTDPCGCCGGQRGGLPARATYLVEYSAELERLHNSAPLSEVVDGQESGGDGTVAADAGNSSEGANERVDSGSTVTEETGQADPDKIIPGDFLLVDCGDFSNNETESKFIQSRYTARSYGLLCYDAVNIGKREISLPQDKLADLLTEFGDVTLVSANVHFTSPEDGPDHSVELNKIVKSFVRVKLENGARVVVTGVVTVDALPHNLAQSLGVVVESPVAAIEDVRKQVKQGEQLVVLVSDLSESETVGIVDIEGIVSIGHRPEHFKLLREKLQESPEVIAIPAGEDRGRSVGRALVEFGKNKPAEMHELAFDKLPKRMEKHPLIVKLLEEMSAEVTEHHRVIHAENMSRDLETVVDYVGRTACAECHSELYEGYMMTRHAFAVTTLVDKDEQSNGLCLPCHTTGYGEVTGFSIAARSEGLDSVGCEQCHGPDEVHIQLMRGADLTGPADGLDEFGLREVREADCRQCHEENTNPDFDYGEKLPLVAHGVMAEQPGHQSR